MHQTSRNPRLRARSASSRRSRLTIGVLLMAAILVAGVIVAGGGPGGAADESSGRLRTYYIAADSVRWNYAPHGRNDITGQAWDAAAAVFTQPGPPPTTTTPATRIAAIRRTPMATRDRLDEALRARSRGLRDVWCMGTPSHVGPSTAALPRSRGECPAGPATGAGP